MAECRLIVDPPQAGSWNMAVDEALLGEVTAGGPATLRFYQWAEPTLSLGYFQRQDDRSLHPASSQCAAVRRQTGGGAILHDRELTYSLQLPAEHPLTRRGEELYQTVHRTVIAAVRLLVDLGGWQLEMWKNAPPAPACEEPFLCFQRRATGDVVLRDPRSGQHHKVLGSAQRRPGGAILQHGSILLGQSPAAPELLGINDLLQTHVTAEALAEVLREATPKSLAATPVPVVQLSRSVRQRAEQLVQEKYANPAWLGRR